ncbi:SpaH/EbpB family LPXTG-anchored major pilin [uncultured Bifidobacterium sp.]|uniref:SpaH/EbpB family LPXTG-anchored major pilin n=2 Tax=uncultured Bifidobacterium sp. TaxID=165187 RepID=UPI00258D6487|nr:SpaH/EbpB family LPXTG-anchored major pilin [uncultured Bifidobacterium sp.]
MKGMFKRALAGVAAAALAATGLALSAGAANAAVATDDGTNTTVTLNAEYAAQFTGHTYKAIKIADYDVYGESPNQFFTLKTVDGIKTQVTAAVNAAIAPETVPTDPAGIDPLVWAQQQDHVKLDKSVDSPYLGDGTTRKFADALRDSIGDSASPLVGPNDAQEGSAGTITVEGKTAEITFNSPGLWLILDQSKVDATDTATGSSKAVPMLVGTPLTINKTNTSEGTVISNGTANVKNQVVSIAKTVDDNTVQRGENAKCTLNTNIPNYVGYKVQGYSFTITDEFDDGAPMEYVSGTLHVSVDGTELTVDDEYTVTGFDQSSKTFTVDLSEYIVQQGFGADEPGENDTFTDAALVGKSVTVTYEAKVTGPTGPTGVLNTPSLTYPNDPTSNESKDTVPGPGVKVFNFDYTIVKKDKTTGAALEGATFVIYRADGGSADNALQTVTTDRDGRATFAGLEDDVKYVIEETGAPAGYLDVDLKFNLEIDATIEGEHENAEVKDVTYEVTGDVPDLVVDGNTSTVTVNNVKSITELPLTGAAGTALFTVLGLLIAGAGALVYMKSRSVKHALRG